MKQPVATAKGGGVDAKSSRDEWMRRALHDLCQPLMALDCLLSVHAEPVPGEVIEASMLRSVMEEGLVECGRMMALVREMQKRMAP